MTLASLTPEFHRPALGRAWGGPLTAARGHPGRRRTRRYPHRLPLALGTALLIGCGASSERGAHVGTRAPELVGTTLAGDRVALSSLEGRPVLLNLWATWCAPCRRETPYLQWLHERHLSEGLRVVGVTVDRRGSEGAVRGFVEEFGVTYTILSDPEMLSMDRYEVVGLPATFLIDREGVIRHAVTGPVAEGDRAFAAALREVLE